MAATEGARMRVQSGSRLGLLAAACTLALGIYPLLWGFRAAGFADLSVDAASTAVTA